MKSLFKQDDLYVGDESFSGDSVLDGWFKHFSELAEPQFNPDFDYTYIEKVSEEVKTISEICNRPITKHEPVTLDEITEAVKSLNKRKAADVNELVAEHIVYGGVNLLIYIQELVNDIILSQTVPECLKSGILHPIFKNKGSCKDSKNYRGITITPILTKILEAVIKRRINTQLTNMQNPLQRGFTRNASPMHCSLIVEEWIRNNRDLNLPTYIAFLDAKSAFDVVLHNNLMRKLYHIDIDDRCWTILNSLHEKATTAVKWCDQLSSTYTNYQGVRQGGLISADMYKVYVNGLLNRISKAGVGAYINDINIAAPTCADDVALLSNDPYDLQRLINISKDYSNMDGYRLQETKSVIFRTQTSTVFRHLEYDWTLGGKQMPCVDSNPHMGITRTSTNQEMNSVLENIRKAKKVIYSLMASGLHGENGLDPESSLAMLQTYVLPVLTYGLEVIIPTSKPLKTIETQYKKTIKQILSLPNNTADPAVYILSGTIPLEAIIHKKILTLFGSIMRLPKSSIEKRLATEQLQNKTLDSHSWFIVVKRLFIKYDLPDIEEVTAKQFEKRQWKVLINDCINRYWIDWVMSQAHLYSSLHYMSKTLVIGKCHPAIKPYNKSMRDVTRIPVKTKIITGTYILQTTRVKFNQNEVNPLCRICNLEDETLEHFLIKCKGLHQIREPILQDIAIVINELIELDQHVKRYSLLQLIIDCQVTIREKTSPEFIETLEKLHFCCRRLCYALHTTRYKMLELVPKRGKKQEKMDCMHTTCRSYKQ